MQFFSCKKLLTIQCVFLSILIAFFSFGNAQAAAEESVTHNLHIGWNYTNSPDTPVSGFRFYKEDVVLCEVVGSEVRSMDCKFQSPPGTFNFYLAIYSAINETALSAPFAFTLYPPTTTLPNAVIEASTTAGNGPLRVSFDASGSTAGLGEIDSYTWDFDDTGNPATGSATYHTYTVPGIYNPVLTIKNSNGCSDQSTVTIVVAEHDTDNAPPQAHFSTSLIQLDNDGLTLELDASNSWDEDGNIISYVWDLGSGSFQTGETITHTFPANKVSTISLTVTDDSGSQYTRSISTITFLKQIHATVIFHINSFLLNKD